MSTIATITPNLQPGYDRNILESLSNRRERATYRNGHGDRTSNLSRNKVDGHVQNCLRSVCILQVADRSHMIVPPIACGRTTSRAWLCVKQLHDQ